MNLFLGIEVKVRCYMNIFELSDHIFSVSFGLSNQIFITEYIKKFREEF